MPKYNVSIDRQLRCRLCFDIEVEADSEDEALGKGLRHSRPRRFRSKRL